MSDLHSDPLTPGRLAEIRPPEAAALAAQLRKNHGSCAHDLREAADAIDGLCARVVQLEADVEAARWRVAATEVVKLKERIAELRDELVASEKRRVEVEQGLSWFSLEVAKAAGCDGVVTGEQIIERVAELRGALETP